jgi:hypothetical protein
LPIAKPVERPLSSPVQRAQTVPGVAHLMIVGLRLVVGGRKLQALVIERGERGQQRMGRTTRSRCTAISRPRAAIVVRWPAACSR